MRAVRRVLFLLLLTIIVGCATPAPEPEPMPAPEPVRSESPAPDRTYGTVHVTASALNVRAEASTDAEVVKQVKRGEPLTVLEENESWMHVRLAGGETGWVAARFVARDGQRATSSSSSSSARRRSGGCPPDSDYAFTKTPTPSFSDRGAHGLVVVEAAVSARGDVTSTKLVSNTTGDETLAFLAQREIKEAKFSPPIRNCLPKAFIFTYRRTF